MEKRSLLNRALSQFLRAVATQIDNGDCDLSDNAATAIFDAVTQDDGRKEGDNDKLVESLGRAYKYLSERQDDLQAEMDALMERLDNIPDNVVHIDFTPNERQ